MILVVDHDPEAFDKAREVLNNDRRVLAASNAEQALALVRRLTFSVVLVDLELPDDAFALIRNLHEADPGLPVIAVTSAVRGAIPVTTKTAGVVEFLPKPVSPAWKPAIERVRAFKRGA